jgi:hypothetical protein
VEVLISDAFYRPLANSLKKLVHIPEGYIDAGAAFCSSCGGLEGRAKSSMSTKLPLRECVSTFS